MPYLQLDVTGTYPVEAKKALAQKMASTYADKMKVDIRRISIAIREVGDGGVWRIVDGEPVPAAVMMCDIRRDEHPNCACRSRRRCALPVSKYWAYARIS